MEFQETNVDDDVTISIDVPDDPMVAQRPEKHLDSPIMVTLLERLQSTMAKVLLAVPDLRPSQFDPRRYNAIEKYARSHSDEFYSSLKNYMLQYSGALDFCKQPPEILVASKYPAMFQYCLKSTYRIHSDYQAAREIFFCELTAYMERMENILNADDVAAAFALFDAPASIGEDCILAANRAALWSAIVDDYRDAYRRHRTLQKRIYGPVRVVLCDGFLILKTDEFSRWQLMTYEQLQMLQDCALARFNVALALHLKFHNGTEMLKVHVDDILRWQEKVLTAIGNSGYELVKAPEAVFKAWLNSLTKGDLLQYSSYNRTLDKMREKEWKLHKSHALVFELDTIVQRVTDIHDAAELFGLTKLSGHPTVNARKSADSVRKEATPVGTVQPFAVRQMVRSFKHLVLSGYLNVHHSWPPMLCPPARGTKLRQLYVAQKTSLTMGEYPLSDLDAVEFKPFVQFDYSEDYLKFLDDKAVCPGASEMAKFWFSGKRNESRRLLQKVLSVKEVDLRKIVERLRRGKFDPDEYCVELTQKERELKEMARCFCKLPFEVRTFFTLIEYNLKEGFMKKYMPQQTMTMSSTDTKQRLYSLVKDAKSRSRSLLEVDFSRWNLRWRAATVNPVARILEDIFGLEGVFTQHHDFFTRATVVLTDKHSLPDGGTPNKPITEWPESELLWRGKHLGGFEGIFQAGWTICTIAMMYWVMHDQNVAFTMAGQGDNQIFALTFDPGRGTMAEQLRKLLAVMEVRCRLLNHEVKPDECIDSSTVLTYSKEIYVLGNNILYNLKFASRSFRRDEIDVPSLSTEIAGVSAGAMACADSVYSTPKAIFWKTFQTIRLLSSRYKSPIHRLEHKPLAQILANNSLLKFVLLTPGSLGGLPAMAWSRFFMKGEVDDLSWDVPAYRALAKHDSILAWDLKLLLDGRYSPRNPKLTQLILDPHSIPIERPKDLKRLVREAVEGQIMQHTKNVWLKEIFSETTYESGDKLMQALTETSPFYPQIMSDVYALSPNGLKDALLSRFTMTRTIVGIAGNPNFMTEISAANAALLRFLIKRWHDAKAKVGQPTLPTSSYQTCQKLRSLWGPTVEHRNIGVYCPLDYPIRPTSRGPRIQIMSRCDTPSLHDSVGVYPPNFGTRTKQKVSDHGFKILSSSSTVIDLKALVMTFSELGATNEFAKLLTKISKSRSPWTVTQLATVLPTAFGGAGAHRHNAINASAFSILGSRTVPTHLNFCSDDAGLLSGGEFDVPIAFQEFYLTGTNVFQVFCHAGLVNSNATLSFCLDDNYEYLPTDAVVAQTIPDIGWSVKPHNALCYVQSLQVSEIPPIPPPATIPHASAKTVRPEYLIYNKLLAKYARKFKLFTSSALVNLPIEVMDMKEFNHCPIFSVTRGVMWFVSAMAVYSAVSEYNKDAHVFFKENLLVLSRAAGGLISRLLLHVDHSSSMYTLGTRTICKPGPSGARDAADHFAGYLYDMALTSIRSRDFITEQVPLILFADYHAGAQLVGDIHATFLLSLQSYDTGKLLLTSYQRLMLRSCRYGFNLQDQPIFVLMKQRATVDLFASALDAAKTPIQAGVKMRLLYVPVIPEEAIRVLRELPKRATVDIHEATLPALRYRPKSAACQMQRTDLDGRLSPEHVCEHATTTERLLESFLSLTKRPFGVYSSALSVWISILQSNRISVARKRVLSIGVGHGAVATAVLLCGAHSVSGVDLRRSFPCISQREGTYKPPEIVRAGFSKRFEWDETVASYGGDVVAYPELLNDVDDYDVIIHDIEQEHTEIALSFPYFRRGAKVIVRLHTCSDWAKYYFDALGADMLFDVTELDTLHVRSYILVVNEFKQVSSVGNYARWEITGRQSFKSLLPPSQQQACDIFNETFTTLDEEVKIVSASELEARAQTIGVRAANANRSYMANQLSELENDLRFAATMFRDVNSLTVTTLESASKRGRRLLARWLANTGTDLTVMRNRLIPTQ